VRWLMPLILLGLASAVSADSLSVCYNYGCVAEADVNFSAGQLMQVRDLLGVARNATEERASLSLAIGWMLGWAGEQTPISADRGGNFADDGVFGRMDCIDHSTTTTRLLRLLESHRWLSFHRVLEPARRVLYLFEFHYSAQIEELDQLATEPASTAEPARYVVDSWFRDNGRPAVVMALPDWLDGQGLEESGGVAVVAGGPGDDPPVEH